MEFFEFPMKVLDVSQGYGFAVDGVSASKFSHKGQKALDLRGSDKGIDPVYAPCSCTVMRILTSSNIVYFQSNEPVIRADGNKTYMTWRFIHMNDAEFNKLGMKVGKTFKQGEICYYEGMKGKVTGNHLHMEVGEGRYISPGSNTKDGITSIKNAVYPHRVMFLKDDTQIVKPCYSWKKKSDYKEPEERPVEPEESNIILDEVDTNVAVPGQKVLITDGILYTGSTSTVGIKKRNATYYIYDGLNISGRYRVTSSIAFVGKGMKFVSGWVDKAVVFNKAEESTENPIQDITTENITFAPGDKVILSGMLYASSTGSSGYKKSNETYYIYDGKDFNGRYRLVKFVSYVGKSTSMVAGYANKENLTRM